jgi:hypothetical protein
VRVREGVEARVRVGGRVERRVRIRDRELGLEIESEG